MFIEKDFGKLYPFWIEKPVFDKRSFLKKLQSCTVRFLLKIKNLVNLPLNFFCEFQKFSQQNLTRSEILFFQKACPRRFLSFDQISLTLKIFLTNNKLKI
ncbi:MAG: hypothetical protein DRR08_24150 [Candidatus Parabeggiatoa sp. nov. 2]|nr:MAG: hypothetical protein B6247_08190 [Beggiatoa sp. 4572_84]RKZ55517.1 MAG: hypothetical protein DRR08_24150 [Gammaproteobacteria bacterium]